MTGLWERSRPVGFWLLTSDPQWAERGCFSATRPYYHRMGRNLLSVTPVAGACDGTDPHLSTFWTTDAPRCSSSRPMRPRRIERFAGIARK